MSEMMLRDASARARPQSCHSALFQRRRRRSACRAGQSTKGATHLIKVAVEDSARLARKARSYSAPIIRRPTAPAFATISTSAISCARIPTRSAICAAVATVADNQLRLRTRLFGAGGDRNRQARLRRRFQGRDRAAARGRPAQIVADSDKRARHVAAGCRGLTISPPSSQHALAWETPLIKRRASTLKPPISARRQVPAVPSIIKQLENSASAGHGTHLCLGTWRLGTWRLGTWRLGTWRLGTWRLGDKALGDLALGTWPLGTRRLGT